MAVGAKPRARDLGVPFDGTTGKWNAITDVPGIQVGYRTIVRGEGPLKPREGPVRTGVTAILPRGAAPNPRPVFAAFSALNGNGEMTGTHWIEDNGTFLGPVCITNTHSVGMVHHAACQWMTQTYSDHFVADHGWAMPVVAETYDGMTNDIVGQHVTVDDALAAIDAAETGPVAEGNVGGGAGMMTYDYKGGSGTASRKIDIADQPFTLGVFVQSNFGSRKDLRIRGKSLPHPDTELVPGHQPETGSIIVIIATDAPLLPHQLKRLARRGGLGIARTGTAGGHYSGDVFLAFSTANEMHAIPYSGPHPVTVPVTMLSEHHLDAVYSAAVDAIEEAVINALVAAESVPMLKPEGGQLEAIDHHSIRVLFDKGNST